MKRKISLTLSLCLLLTSLLGACGGHDPAETTPSEKTEAVVTEREPSSDTDPEIPAETDTEAATEADTEPPVEIVIPEGVLPNIRDLLKGDSVIVNENHSMKNASFGALKTGGTFVSTGGSLFKSGAEGLTAANTGWDALGFAAPVSTDTYTAEVEFSVHANDRGGEFNAAMVGLFCKTAENLFIDGGLWFSFRENKVAVYVKQSFQTVLDKDLPFDAADGIRFKAVGDRETVKVYANDLLVATVNVTSEGITVLNAEGAEAAKTDLTHLSVNGDGYFRYMTHYANSTLASMKLTGETQREYTPDDRVYAFMSDMAYGFADKAQYLADVPSAIYSELLFADGVMLGEMFGFACTVEGDTLTMIRDEATLTFEANTAEVKINGEAYGFPTVIKKEGGFLLAVAKFGELLGYSPMTNTEMTVLAVQNNLKQEAMTMAQERFDLYRDIVYNYDDVACDQTGVGRYDPVPYEERLVGIAYTTWHRPATKWGGTATWDMPLYGAYCSDDEEVIRRHGEMLRDAGIDFVFVDWSNNTEYVPETMREQRADFRMIEEATDKLFDVWSTIEGAPKICIFVGPGHNGPKTIENGAHQKKVDQVWNDYVTNPNRADMYFHYDGKPLLICYGATPNQYTAVPEDLWDDDRYTVRWMTGYVGQQSNLFRPGNLESARFWSWEERGAQTYTVHNKKVEAVTVSAATRSQGKESTTGYIPEAGRQNGATLKKQFQRACDLGARIVLIVSWNEWTTGEQPSAEVSKDMEPSVIHGTFYYDLMREQIKKFKGKV
ncbi:MAG: hypothetical protein IJW00_08485 [Clostridia bacterium]|nr:hypothetical protein [Clostridia bacterium]